MWHGGWMNGGMGAWGAVWSLVGLAALVLFVVGLVWLVRSVAAQDRDRGVPTRSGGSPREILDVRYARGEIDRDEYVRARRDLGDPVAEP